MLTCMKPMLLRLQKSTNVSAWLMGVIMPSKPAFRGYIGRIEECSSMHDIYNSPIHYFAVQKIMLSGCESHDLAHCLLPPFRLKDSIFWTKKRTNVTKVGNVNTIRLERAMITSQS
jgi:hypothetical protein